MLSRDRCSSLSSGPLSGFHPPFPVQRPFSFLFVTAGVCGSGRRRDLGSRYARSIRATPIARMPDVRAVRNTTVNRAGKPIAGSNPAPAVGIRSRVAQRLEHAVDNREVASSILAPAIASHTPGWRNRRARLTLNQKVEGSTPSPGILTTKN